jgi:very-short-patch-repair endonuclease
VSAAEDELATQLRAAGVEFEREVRFHPTRRWRADFRVGAVLVEVEGGGYIGGRHGTGIGMERDCEKYSEAAVLGYRVLRVTPKHIRSGFALDVIERAIRGG